MEEVEILSNFSFVSKILPLEVKCEQEFASLLCEILFFSEGKRERDRTSSLRCINSLVIAKFLRGFPRMNEFITPNFIVSTIINNRTSDGISAIRNSFIIIYRDFHSQI